ncbi:MAG TPA: peptidoglycan editing factor PgeF [Methylomirabilota bacterium]|nr:peptidoglycan editing factor PgeF [Methylomirabilota bacterium]
MTQELRFVGDPPLYLTSALLSNAGLSHLFTTRYFPGVTPPAEPTSPFGPDAVKLLAERGLARAPVAFLRQVHGARAARVERGGLAGRGDVLATEKPGLPLAVFTADCLSIIVYDPIRRALAVAHAGWRGTIQGVARAAAQALIAVGGAPEDFVVGIGPSIGPCCYEVDRPVIEPLSAAFPERWAAWARPAGPGRWRLDLWEANEDQLRAAGLRPERIDNPRLCTACRTDLFFSYRRGRGQGRLVAVAALPDGPAPTC